MTTSPAECTAKRLADISSVFLRLALGISFLSAVGDRFGFWGAFGQSHVAWGDFAFYRLHCQTELVHAIRNNSSTGLGFHLC